MKKRCPIHGLVLRPRGSKAEYCPACGEKLLSFSIFPLFKIYFPPALGYLTLVFLAVCAFAYLLNIRGCIQGCNQEAQQRKQNIANAVMALPEDWRTLYYLVNQDSDYGELEIIQDFCKTHRDLPLAKPEYIGLFSNVVSSYERAEKLDLVQSSCRNIETEP
jgi:hypothetical protein